MTSVTPCPLQDGTASPARRSRSLPQPLAAGKLRAWRRSRALTQEAFAAEIGVGRSIVARWETGQRTPSKAKMAELAELGVCQPNDWFQLDAS